MAGCVNVVKHNLREINNIEEFMNKDMIAFNEYGGIEHSTQFLSEYQRMIDEAQLKRKIQKNASRIIEFVVSTSHEYCKNWNVDSVQKEKLDSYFKDSKKFIENKYGNVIISTSIHYDEMTPHMHILCVPLVRNKDTNEVKFSSSGFVGGIKELHALHSEFFEKVGKHYDLERGNMGERVKHSELKQYRAWQEEQRKIIEAKQNDLENRREQIDKQELAIENQMNHLIKKEKMYDEFEKTVSSKAPKISVPPFIFSEKDRKSWRDRIQESVNNAFMSFALKYNKLVEQYNVLAKKYNEVLPILDMWKGRAEKAEHALATKPIEEIQAERELEEQRKRQKQEQILQRKRGYSQEGFSR